jgi:hypothetical protein
MTARNLGTVGALAALFLVPLALAFFTYYGTDWRPAQRVNHGVLITPPRQLPVPGLPCVLGAASAGTLRGKWTLVYIGNGRCDEDCRWTLYVMRQTRLSLNDDMSRVERVFLANGACCARDYLARADAGVTVLDASGPAATALLAGFAGDARQHTLYVVDPLGNLMMSYDARLNPHGLLEDLKRLLRLSHIG